MPAMGTNLASAKGGEVVRVVVGDGEWPHTRGTGPTVEVAHEVPGGSEQTHMRGIDPRSVKDSAAAWGVEHTHGKSTHLRSAWGNCSMCVVAAVTQLADAMGTGLIGPAMGAGRI